MKNRLIACTPLRFFPVFASFTFLMLLAHSALAQTPTASNARTAFGFQGANGQCVPSKEICGDSIDQDCDGLDTPCTGNDQDQDGYPRSQDCDDQNRMVYPGISVACFIQGKSGTQLCKADGTFSACSTTPLCEAKGGGRCYYVSKLTGSDTNAGTFDRPFKSYLPFVSYYSSPPSYSVKLKAGDVVYFMSGVYNDIYTYIDSPYAFFLRGVKGAASLPITFKAYPGAKVTFQNSSTVPPLVVWSGGYLTFEGIEVSNTRNQGPWFAESSDIELRNMWIHDLDGEDNNNMSGIKLTASERVYIHHNVIHDNYDRTNADTGGNATENSRNLVFFGGGNIRVSRNVIFQTPSGWSSKTGACIGYKHSATVPGATFEVDHNIMWNCAFYGVGSGTYNTHIHHNLLIDSGSFGTRDYGGPTHNENILVDYNTMVGGIGFNHNPSTTYGPVGLLEFKNNIVVDNSQSYDQEKSMITVSTYGSDSLYNTIVSGGLMKFSGNCYYNPSTAPRFALFASVRFGALGSILDFNGWRALGYDLTSRIEDPKLSASSYVPQNPNCQNAGWYAGE